MEDTMSDSNPEEMDFVPRSHTHLMNYPVEFRWELTRRHPYYIALWKDVRSYYQDPTEGDIQLQLYRKGASLLLGAIGVFGQPVAPETPFKQLAGEDPSFLVGSLQPVTFRSITTRLLAYLSPRTQHFLADMLCTNANNATNPTISEEQRQANHFELMSVFNLEPLPELDCVPPEPFFAMNVGASQQTIKEDANWQAKLWKARRNNKSPKIHTKKLPKYLAVWDALEGWTGSGYDIGQEKTIKQVMRSSKQKSSTIHDHFRAAFHAIAGQNFSSSLWWKVLGRYKIELLTGVKSITYARLIRRMNRYSPAAPIVTETTLTSSATFNEHASPIQFAGEENDSADMINLAEALTRRIAEGQTNDRIIEELELTNPRMTELLDYMRVKQTNFGDLMR
jgi:hypothetical protein